MAEWPNASVLKTGVLHGTGGSNPSSSEQKDKSPDLSFFLEEEGYLALARSDDRPIRT